MRSGFVQSGTELSCEFLSGVCAAGRYAEALGNGDEIHLGREQFQQRVRVGSCGCGADPMQLKLQYGVSAVVEYDRGDVELFARHRPQRRDRVDGASVGLEGDDGPMRRGHGGTDRHR